MSAPFLGPDGTTATFYNLSDQAIAAVHNGHRWVQYRAYFDTENTNVTPFLYGVRVNYNLMQEVEVLQPACAFRRLL